MKPPRFLFVVGIGQGPAAHPVWPDVHQPFVGDLDPDGSWVAWRLTGANHRELGRSCRVFVDLAAARHDAEIIHRRILETQTQTLTVPRTGTWGWRLTLDGVAVATSSRGYARHRECTYNVAAFITAAGSAEVSEAEPPRAWRLVEQRVANERVVGPVL